MSSAEEIMKQTISDAQEAREVPPTSKKRPTDTAVQSTPFKIRKRTKPPPIQPKRPERPVSPAPPNDEGSGSDSDNYGLPRPRHIRSTAECQAALRELRREARTPRIFTQSSYNEFAEIEAQIDREIAEAERKERVEQAEEEQREAARPASQPYAKLSPFDIDIRSKRPLEIAKAEEGKVDRTFDKNVTPEYWRYERKINKTSAARWGRTSPPLKKSTDQRLKPARKSPTPPPTPQPRPKGPSLAQLRRNAERRRSLAQLDDVRVWDVPSDTDDAVREPHPVREAEHGHKQVDLRDEYLDEFLEMADRDPYAGIL